MTVLDVWLGSETIGQLERTPDRRLTFRYADWVRTSVAGAPVLSVSMPVRARPYAGDLPQAFFEGLLPEGEARRMIAYDLRVGDDDAFDLLSVIGRDCAGAVSLLPSGEAPDTSLTTAAVGEAEIARRLRDLPVNPLGVDRDVRVSLAGMQAKLLLTRTPDGWALPAAAPSTHILKPQSPHWGSSVENEHFCMEVARRVGLPVPTVSVAAFEDLAVLVVERYDRIVEAGQVRRVHQEDLTQALGLPPSRKYEAHGGPTLRDCARVLARWSAEPDDLLALLDRVAVSAAIGNADLHAKNISLLHGPDYSVRQIGRAHV